MAFSTSAQDFFVSNGLSKQFEFIQNPMSPEPPVTRVKALPAKGSEKGYGDVPACCLPTSNVLFCTVAANSPFSIAARVAV